MICLAIMLMAVVLGSAARADNWPAWRGPAGTGITTENGLPVHWSSTHNVRWKVALHGAGASTPVVWGDRIFLTASDSRLNDRLHIFCYHRRDGRLLWHRRLFGSAPTDLYAPGGMAVPTPVTDGNHVIALFGTGDLACLDLDGKPVWLRSLAQEYGPFRNRWGMASSPVLAGDLVILQVDHWGPSYLLAIDRKTGATCWKTGRDAAVNWSTPLVVTVKDHVEVITIGTHRIKSYDLASGVERWTVGGMDNQCIPSPVAEGNLLFACSAEGTFGIRLDGRNSELEGSSLVWKNKRGNPFVPSPVAYQGCLYVVGDKGIGTCLDAATGKQLWKERLGESYHASLLAGDGKVYFTSKEGMVRVVRAGPVFELLAENDMGEGIIASPAVSRGDIFLRGEKHLFCISAQ
jgi:outer membrane protein assembly factor BamB